MHHGTTDWTKKAFGLSFFFFGLLALLTGLITGASPAQARDMHGRMGLGYNSEFANSLPGGMRVPGVSIKYGLTRDIDVAGIAGIATTSPSNSVAALKLFKGIFFEPNLNFYSMAGLGLLSFSNKTGIQVIAGFGVEFFIPGLESLGFSVETGGSFDNGNTAGTYALRTLGVSFLDAGIHFYF